MLDTPLFNIKFIALFINICIILLKVEMKLLKFHNAIMLIMSNQNLKHFFCENRFCAKNMIIWLVSIVLGFKIGLGSGRNIEEIFWGRGFEKNIFI